MTSKHASTRDTLIHVGAELIAEQGYHATGLNAVLKAAAVPKGSFYHYFASKEDFGLTVIDAFAETYKPRLDALVVDDGRAPLDRLRRFFAAGRDDMAGCDHSRGCLIGSLGQELSARSDQFRERLDTILKGWETRIAGCLEQALARGELSPEADSAALASFILSGWQGALLRAKTLKSVTPMQHFEDVLFARVLR
ncbi:TetR/AcrR family transcriptional regulator [Halomonas sp. YLGW01]|uniref:TetR/AcrR family transcriptional regulator n=1 Tax=Halomonas sp. YLGW01 TaxID=2773308 RepID=UPI0017844F54|nr:TetR/AcrR family transcriptional regulator [Halomonas sp. YLGW01]